MTECCRGDCTNCRNCNKKKNKNDHTRTPNGSDVYDLHVLMDYLSGHDYRSFMKETRDTYSKPVCAFFGPRDMIVIQLMNVSERMGLDIGKKDIWNIADSIMEEVKA